MISILVQMPRESCAALASHEGCIRDVRHIFALLLMSGMALQGH